MNKRLSLKQHYNIMHYKSMEKAQVIKSMIEATTDLIPRYDGEVKLSMTVTKSMMKQKQIDFQG